MQHAIIMSKLLKHPILIPDIIKKSDALFQIWYQAADEFIGDILLMYGEKLRDIPGLVELINELEFIWNHSI